MVSSLSYATWNEFIAEFVMEFCLKNKLLTSQTDLEMSKYFQGSRNVDEYINKFVNSSIELDASKELISS